MKFDHINNFNIKILLILSFILINLILLILMISGSANGYEQSVYDQYPIFLWFLIVMVLFLGQAILLGGIQNNNNKHALSGFFVILFINFILIALPIIKGYPIYGRDDVLSHIGFMKDIYVTGHIGKSNFYPIEHIFGVSFSFITQIVLERVSIMIPVIFYLFFLLSFYPLYKSLSHNKNYIYFGLILSSIPIFFIFMSYCVPNYQSLAVLPFALYLIVMSRKSKYPVEFSILAILFLLLIVFFHPLVVLSFLLILAIFNFSNSIYKRYLIENKENYRSTSILILIGIVCFFTWGTYAYYLVNTISRIYSWLIGEASSQFQTNYDLLNDINPPIPDFLYYVINNYGSLIVIGIASSICLLYLLIMFRRSKSKLSYRNLFLASSFLSFVILTLFVLFTVSTFGFLRMYLIAALFGIMLISSTLYDYISDNGFKIQNRGINILKSNKSTIMAIFLLLILSLNFITIFNIYPSSRSYSDNYQVSHNEIDGMKFFLENRKINITTILERGISTSRFNDLINGKDSSIIPIRLFGRNNIPVDHFGYNNTTSLSDTYKKPLYLLLTTQGINHYEYRYGGKYKDQWKFNQTDYDRLEIDPFLQKIYESGDLNIFIMDIR